MPRTADERIIRPMLDRDRGWALYALADLAPGHREHCTWFVEEGPAPGALLLLYRAFALPVIVAFGPAERLRPLFDEAMEEPHHFVVCMEDVLEALGEARRIEDRVAMTRMLLDRERFPGPPPPGGAVVRLSPDDLPAIRKLYAHWRASDGSPDFFDAETVGRGAFHGVRRGDELVAVSGTHAVAEEEGVAAVGGIYTHPDHRRQGHAGRATAAVVAELVDRGFETIGLNVARANGSARRMYERLGFRWHCDYVEAHVHRRVAGF